MKISKLISDICEIADYKFVTTDHTNDGVSVSIYHNGECWQLSLEKPTPHELDHGEITEENLHTVKVVESLTAFFTQGSTLLGTLRSLRKKLELASKWE